MMYVLLTEMRRATLLTLTAAARSWTTVGLAPGRTAGNWSGKLRPMTPLMCEEGQKCE